MVKFSKGPAPVRVDLRAFLDERMVKYSAAGRAAGISPGHMTRIMNGERSMTPALARRFGELFGVDPDLFYQGARMSD